MNTTDRWTQPGGAAYDDFLGSTVEPERFHANLWKSISLEAKDGPFWKMRGGFSKNPQLHEFGITEFSDYAEFLAHHSQSRLSPLTGRPIIWWAESTGTTSKNKKLVPFTQSHYFDTRKARAIGSKIYASHLDQANDSRILTFTGLNPRAMPGTGLPFGLMSAFSRAFLFPDESGVAALPSAIHDSHVLFKRWAPLYGLVHDVRMIAAVTAAPILEFLEWVNEAGAEAVEFLGKGMQPPPPLPPLSCPRERLVYLREIFSSGHFPKLGEIWPSLNVVTCWKSGSSATLLGQLASLLPGSVKIVHAQYAATEGVVALPGFSDAAGGPVFATGTIVEFLKVGDRVDPANLKKIWEIERDVDYEVFLTNRLGFVRYRLHDIVRCIGHMNRIPVVQFRQKEGAAIALGMVYLLEDDLLEAIRQAGSPISDPWCFAPSEDCRGLDLLHNPGESCITSVAERVEVALRAIHNTYDSLRTRGMLRAVRPRHFSGGDLPAGARSSDSAQVKPIRVLRDPVRLL